MVGKAQWKMFREIIYQHKDWFHENHFDFVLNKNFIPNEQFLMAAARKKLKKILHFQLSFSYFDPDFDREE